MPKLMKLFAILFGFAFTLTLAGMIYGAYWNYQMYQECLRDGHKSYQCKAMLDNSSYVAVDDMNGR